MILLPSDSEPGQLSVFVLISDALLNTVDPGLIQCNFGKPDLDSNDVVTFGKISSHFLSPQRSLSYFTKFM